jgi:hypothetical protein
MITAAIQSNNIANMRCTSLSSELTGKMRKKE